jgi:hypothetical protein
MIRPVKQGEKNKNYTADQMWVRQKLIRSASDMFRLRDLHDLT